MKIAQIFCIGLLLNLCITLESHADDKYRIAVSELTVSKSVNANNAKMIRESNLISEIENSIRNSRKFELLSRDSNVLAKIRDEQNFSQSDLAAQDMAVVEGGLKTAQSLVLVEVTNLSIGHSAKKLPRVEKYEVRDSASLSLNVQLVDATTGSINISFPVQVSSGSNAKISNSAGGSGSYLVPALIKKSAGIVSNKMFDALFPMSVVIVKGNDIYVNRGQDSGIEVGQQYEIFEKGEELIDPDTGEDLGTTESKIGVAKVVKVKPKVTIMQMKSGKSSDVKKGFIARKPQQ
jgi:hypothetical protein